MPQQTRARNNQKSTAVFAIAIGVVVLLGIVAVVSTRGGSDDGGATVEAGVEQLRSVEVSGTPLPEFGGEPTSDPAAGTESPVVSGETFDGTSMSIGEPGEPQLVFFLAHWCPHCQREVPVITEWIEENGAPEGIALKAVSTGVNDDRPNYPPSEWLDREGWPVQTMADDESSTAAAAFGLSGYPFFVAIDAEGRVVARDSGELGVAQLEALVAAAKA